jgi:hypothetical protein
MTRIRDLGVNRIPLQTAGKKPPGPPVTPPTLDDDPTPVSVECPPVTPPTLCDDDATPPPTFNDDKKGGKKNGKKVSAAQSASFGAQLTKQLGEQLSRKTE